MTDQFAYSFPWPLQGYEGQEPLSEYVRCMETDITNVPSKKATCG